MPIPQSKACSMGCVGGGICSRLAALQHMSYCLWCYVPCTRDQLLAVVVGPTTNDCRVGDCCACRAMFAALGTVRRSCHF